MSTDNLDNFAEIGGIVCLDVSVQFAIFYFHFLSTDFVYKIYGRIHSLA